MQAGNGNYYNFYRSHETERELCAMELSALFPDAHINGRWAETAEDVAPGRSPFVTGRLEALFASPDLDEVCEFAAGMELEPETGFKVLCLKESGEMDYAQRRETERRIGSRMRGRAEMRNPGDLFGVLRHDGLYRFGPYLEPDNGWQERRHKPRNYSTGLGVALCRSLLNIAAPRPEGLRLLDPCCGMGNVLIEGLEMGMDILGCDINPLAVQGARINLAHFGHPPGLASLGDMRGLDGHFDAAVLDLPYNLCSVLSDGETAEMLAALRRLAKRAVVVSTLPQEDGLREAGFTVRTACRVFKGRFGRMIWLVE